MEYGSFAQLLPLSQSLMFCKKSPILSSSVLYITKGILHRRYEHVYVSTWFHTVCLYFLFQRRKTTTVGHMRDVHSNGNVILTKFSSLTVVVTLITYDAPSSEYVVKITFPASMYKVGKYSVHIIIQSGARFTNDFLPANQIRRKLRLAVTPLLAIRSRQIFAHGTTAQLSCHVQNVAAITLLDSRWQWNEISIEFEMRRKNR